MQEILVNTNSSINLLNSIMEHCDDIITLKDLNLKYIACNKAFVKCIGIPSESDIIGQHIKNVIPHDVATQIEEKVQEVLTYQKTVSHNFKTIIHGQQKIIHQTITPIISCGVAKGILAVARDVTNEENLKHELLKKMAQMDTLLEHLPLHVYMKDKNRRYIVGPNHSKSFVYEGYDCFADNIQLNMDCAQEEADQEDEYVFKQKKVLTKEKSTLDYNNLEHWYKVSKIPIFDENDDVNSLLVLAQNIDKEKQQESQKDLFIATLTHDLKNPLLAQMSSLKMLKEGMFGEINKEQSEILDMIIESTDYMRNMLFSIIKTYKENNGLVELQKESFDINKLTEKSIREITNFATERKLSIQYHSKLNKNNKYIFADETQLRRVVGNLLNNAAKYALEGSEINVKIELDKEGKNLIYKVQNSSYPISESLKKQIFDKYVCESRYTGYIGTGLGLYYCKKVIEEGHDGTIDLITDGKNNTFMFTIPIVTPDTPYCSYLTL